MCQKENNMDIKSLIEKMDAIEANQVANEDQQIDEVFPLLPMAVGWGAKAAWDWWQKNHPGETPPPNIAPPEPAPGPTSPADQGKAVADYKKEHLAKLQALLAQLQATEKQGGSEKGETKPDVKPDTKPDTKTDTEKTLAQKAGIGAGMTAGGLAGATLGKKFGGAKGAALGGLTGAALGGLGVNAFQNESVSPSIAQSLTESFGYDFDGQLDEYSMDQFASDAGDFGRGAWNGATLGLGSNIAAGAQSMVGPGSYKDYLAKQIQAQHDAETRSPYLYGAGDLAGSVAAPIPGGAILKGAGKAAELAKLGKWGTRAATGAGVAADIAANQWAQDKITGVKNASNVKTLGKGGDQKLAQLQAIIGVVPDGKMGPATHKALQAWQSENGLTPDGKPGQKTYTAAGIAESTQQTVAENIQSLQQRLAMIEESANITYVYLDESGYVWDEDGELIGPYNQLMEAGAGALLSKGWNAVKRGAKGAWNGVKNFAKGGERIAGADASGAPITKKTGLPAIVDKAKSAGSKAVSAVKANPGKAALGAAALGTAGYAGYNALASDKDTTTPTGGTGGGAGGGTGGSTAGDTKPTPSTTTPSTQTAGPTPEQLELIKQIQDEMQGFNREDGMGPAFANDQEVQQVIASAQAEIDKVTNANKLQTATDTATAAAAADKTAAPAQAGAAQGQTSDADNSTLKVYKPDANGNFHPNDYTEPNKAPVKENDELARWLKIARG